MVLCADAQAEGQGDADLQLQTGDKEGPCIHSVRSPPGTRGPMHGPWPVPSAEISHNRAHSAGELVGQVSRASEKGSGTAGSIYVPNTHIQCMSRYKENT